MNNWTRRAARKRPLFAFKEGVNIKQYRIVIDQQTLDRYTNYYFSKHPRATNPPIRHPYHPSINEWMIMKRPMMNALKQKWKDFVVWIIEDQGYSNLRIERCNIDVDTYYATNRRHDVDNSVIKFILDGMCDSGLIVDDDSKHVLSLTLRCHTDKDRPRTELTILATME